MPTRLASMNASMSAWAIRMAFRIRMCGSAPSSGGSVIRKRVEFFVASRPRRRAFAIAARGSISANDVTTPPSCPPCPPEPRTISRRKHCHAAPFPREVACPSDDDPRDHPPDLRALGMIVRVMIAVDQAPATFQERRRTSSAHPQGNCNRPNHHATHGPGARSRPHRAFSRLRGRLGPASSSRDRSPE